MRVAITTVQVPFLTGGAEMHADGLCHALRRAGHEAEIVRVPFKWYPAQTIPQQILACRLLDLTESMGTRIDRVIGLKFPAYLIPHPDKVLWILHQHRAAYDMWDQHWGDLYGAPSGAEAREAIRSADTRLIPEARRVFANSRNVADRLRRFNGIEATPLYHPPPLAELYRSEAQGDYLLMPSRFNGPKRQDLVVEAMGHTRQPVRVVFIGGADNPTWAEGVMARADALAPGRAQWLGPVSDTRKVDLLSAALGVMVPPAGRGLWLRRIGGDVVVPGHHHLYGFGWPVGIRGSRTQRPGLRARSRGAGRGDGPAMGRPGTGTPIGSGGARLVSRPGFELGACGAMPARLKLNLFSPLPPLHSEIGNHSLTVAAALQDLADITLWTPQTEPPVLDRPNLDRGVPVICYDPAAMDWPRLNRADANIYNLGNNATFHRAIFDVARLSPGIIVLHDTCLQHFFARYSETPGADRAFYLDSIKRAHGMPALRDAQRWLAGEASLDTLVERYPMTLAALDPALAVVVHNEEEQRNLAAQTRTPVFHLPLAFAAGPPPDRKAANGTLRLVVFGFLGPNRRLGPILDVIASLPDPDVLLDVYGALEDPEPIDAQIATLGLVGRVRRHGFVPEAELQAALARADCAINLRYPSMGEASASQLRIWDMALPSIVTRTGWYATLPDNAVFFVEPEREVETLAAHLEALRRDPARFRLAGLRGRAVLEQQHTPAGYAAGLLNVAEQIGALHARRQAIDLSRTAARLLLDMTEVAGIALCADAVAAAVAGLTQRG